MSRLAIVGGKLGLAVTVTTCKSEPESEFPGSQVLGTMPVSITRQVREFVKGPIRTGLCR